MKNLTLIFAIIIQATISLQAQSTINPNDLSTILIGGAQEIGILDMELLQQEIVDLEPEPLTFVSFAGLPNILEAGLPAIPTGGANENQDIWINYSSRQASGSSVNLSIRSNNKLPKKMKVRFEIISQNISGSGNLGTPIIGEIDVKTGAQIIIANIGTGHTGDGLGVGYNVKYTIINPNSLDIPADYEIIYELLP